MNRVYKEQVDPKCCVYFEGEPTHISSYFQERSFLKGSLGYEITTNRNSNHLTQLPHLKSLYLLYTKANYLTKLVSHAVHSRVTASTKINQNKTKLSSLLKIQANQ